MSPIKLLRLARNRNLGSTATAAFELLEVVSKFSKSRMATEISTAEEWERFNKKVTDIHGVFVRAAAINKIDASYRQTILQDIAELHSCFNMLASTASEKAGDIHANP